MTAEQPTRVRCPHCDHGTVKQGTGWKTQHRRCVTCNGTGWVRPNPERKDAA